jgi:hypothetical protein
MTAISCRSQRTSRLDCVIANHFGYSAAFLMALGALAAAALAGRTVFVSAHFEPALVANEPAELFQD